MKSLITIALLAFLSINTQLHAASYELVQISRDDNDLVYKLIIDSDDESIIDQVRKETFQGGILVNNEILNHNELEKGIVLEEQKGFKALVLKSFNFDLVLGGEIEVDTLFSGVTSERKSYYFEIAKSESGWSIFNGSSIVKQLMIKVNKVPLLGVVGIKDLEIK